MITIKVVSIRIVLNMTIMFMPGKVRAPEHACPAHENLHVLVHLISTASMPQPEKRTSKGIWLHGSMPERSFSKPCQVRLFPKGYAQRIRAQITATSENFLVPAHPMIRRSRPKRRKLHPRELTHLPEHACPRHNDIQECP